MLCNLNGHPIQYIECPEFKERSEEVKTKERRKHRESNRRQRRKEEEEQPP